MNTWPTQAQAYAFYGDPRGNGTWNHNWYVQNIVTITPPFDIFFDGGKVVFIHIHRKCAAAFSAWLQKVWDNAGHDQAQIKRWGMDQFSGSMAYRSKRGGTTPSMHEFGCAVDFDAAHNQFLSHKPHFQEFHAQVVQPFLDLGGTWGADWNENGIILDEKHPDGMHFQFAHVVAHPTPAPGKAPIAPSRPKASLPAVPAKASGSPVSVAAKPVLKALPARPAAAVATKPVAAISTATPMAPMRKVSAWAAATDPDAPFGVFINLLENIILAAEAKKPAAGGPR